MKKVMLTGMGVISLTKEKVEDMSREFVEKGKMTEEEGKKFVNEILEKSDESKNELKKQIEKIVGKTMEKMDLASKSDIEAVKSELAEIRKKLSESE